MTTLCVSVFTFMTIVSNKTCFLKPLIISDTERESRVKKYVHGCALFDNGVLDKERVTNDREMTRMRMRLQVCLKSEGSLFYLQLKCTLPHRKNICQTAHNKVVLTLEQHVKKQTQTIGCQCWTNLLSSSWLQKQRHQDRPHSLTS